MIGHMEKCPYYRWKKVPMTSNTLRKSRAPVFLDNIKAWCVHPETPKREHSVGSLACKGEFPARCPIKEKVTDVELEQSD